MIKKLTGTSSKYSATGNRSALGKTTVALMMVAMTLNISAPVSAQSARPGGGANTAPASNGTLNLDLASTSRTYAPPSTLGSGSVSIRSGNSVVQVNGQSLLTPAERLAVWQVISTGSQSIRLGSMGNAVGGTFALRPSFNTDLTSLVIPKGVTSLASSSSLNILGDLTNSGTLRISNPVQNALVNIGANNIVNNVGALITSTGALHLGAANNILNYGQIIGANSLTFTAGNQIVNAASSTPNSGVIQAAGNVNLNANNLVNSGSIASLAGNININSTTASNILVNNTNGVLSALKGDINVRDALFYGKYDANITGGNLFSNNLNVWSGNGTADLNVNKISSLINVSAGNIHILGNTPDLQLGNIEYQEDPTFYNLGGNIKITTALDAASPGGVIPGVAIVASGNVTSSISGTVINTAIGAAPNPGASLIVIAGAKFTITGTALPTGVDSKTGNLNPPGNNAGVLTLLGPSATGGMIDFGTAGNISTAAVGVGNQAGAPVTLAAFAGTGAQSGAVRVGNISTNSNNLLQPNGNVTIIAGAKTDPSGFTAITTGNISTDSAGSTQGGILLVTGNPVVGGGVFQIINGVVVGPNLSIASASLGTQSINTGASITTGNLATNVAPITILAGSNVNLNGNITTNGTLANVGTGIGPGGNVAVVAGGTISGTIATLSTKGATGSPTTFPSNAGGDVFLLAGANAKPSVTHTFFGNSQSEFLSSNTDQVNSSFTVTGASASGGNINFGSLTTLDTRAGATQILAPVNNHQTGGAVTLVAFAGASSPTSTGLVTLQPATSLAITTGGAPALNTQAFVADTTDTVNTVIIPDTTGLTGIIENGVVISGPGIPGSQTIKSFTPFVPPAATTLTLTGPGSTATANGVSLLAGTPQSGTTNINGDVTIISGAQAGVGTASIKLGSTGKAITIDSSGGNEGGGNIRITTGTATAGLPFFYAYTSNSTQPAIKSGTFTPLATLASSDISITGSLVAVGGNFQTGDTQQTFTTDIAVKSGGNLTIGNVSNANNTLPPGGPPATMPSSTINLQAAGVMNLNGTISSNAGAASVGKSGADGGTIILSAASFAFPNGQQLISADGTGGYVLNSDPLNFTGNLNSTVTVTQVFTTVNGTGLVVGSTLTDNLGNTQIKAGTTIAKIDKQGTQANAVLSNNSAVVDVVTTGFLVGDQVAGGAIQSGTTVANINAPSVQFTGDTSVSNNKITNVVMLGGKVITDLVAGTPLVGPGIPAGAKVQSAAATTVIVDVPGGGNLTGTFTGTTYDQAGQLTLSKSIGPTGAGEIVMVGANGQIELNQAALVTTSGAKLTDNLPVGQNGGNGGSITITTTGANPITVGTGGFKISAIGDTAGGNGGTLNLNSGSSIAVDPTSAITMKPTLNNLAQAGFNTLIVTGAGPTFNFKAATTLFINGSLNADGAPSTLAGALGSPGGNGGTINIEVNSAQPFNIGGASTGGNGVASGGILTANGNLGTVPGFGSGGTISIVNKGVGTAAAPSGIIAASGSIQVQAATATDAKNLGSAIKSYIGGSGGHIILKGQTVLSKGGLDASGGAYSETRGSGDGGSIVIDTNYTSATNPFFIVDPTASASILNGVIGTLNARGNSALAVPPTIKQGTEINTLPSGNGGTISLINSGGGIQIGAKASMSVAASDANALQGIIGGSGGKITLHANGAASGIQSAIGFSVNGGAEASPAAIVATGPVNNGVDVPITVPSTDGLFVGQTVTLQDSLGGPSEAVIISEITSPTAIKVFQVVSAPAGKYTTPSLQAYFIGGDGGRLSISTNSANSLTIGSATGNNFIAGKLTANGFSGGTINVTNKFTGGITVGAGTISTTAIFNTLQLVSPNLVTFGGFGGNISLQALGSKAAVVIGDASTAGKVALNVDGYTVAKSTNIGPATGGIGGNITIVSNSTVPFTVNGAAGTLNGVIGGLSANGGVGTGNNNSAGTVTIVNLGGGITVAGPGVNVVGGFSSISIQPGVRGDGKIGTNGTSGNGGSLRLTAPAASSPVIVAGAQGIIMNGNGNGEHDASFADGLGGSVSITSNSSKAFNIGSGSANGTAGPINANGWSGGSVSITNLGGDIVLDNTSGTQLTVTPNKANPLAIGNGGVQLAGGPGGSITMQAPKGIVAITGGLVADGGAQDAGDLSGPLPYFLQGGRGGQIAIQSGKGIFNIGGATAGTNGTTGVLSAQGAIGGILNISAVNGGDIVVSSAASLNVTGFQGITCPNCNETLPAGNPPTPISFPGGDSGGIFLQASTTGGFVFIAGTASTGGLNVAGGSAANTTVSCSTCTAGPHDGNGGKIAIVTNTTVFNIGSAASGTNGLGSGGSKLDASGYNGGSIGIRNQGTGGISFNPSLLSVSAAKGSVASPSDVPGGNGGIIDLQAPAGKLGVNTSGVLSASATASKNGQTGASGGIITLSALQIDESVANLTITATGAQTAGQAGKGGTVIISQNTSTASQVLNVGSAALTINVNGTPGAKLGGNILLRSPAGIAVLGNLATDSSATGRIDLDAVVGSKVGITQAPASTIKTGELNLFIGDAGTGASGLTTQASQISLRSSGKVTITNTTGTLTLNSAYMFKADLNVTAGQGNLIVNTVSTPGNLFLTANGASDVADSGIISIKGNVAVGGNATLTAVSGDGLTGGLIIGEGAGLVSAASINLNPGISGAILKTSTGLLTIGTTGTFGVIISNTGNLLLNTANTSALGALRLHNVGSITTIGSMANIGSINLDNVPGTEIFVGLEAGSNVLNANAEDLTILVPGSTLQGVGIPAGTTVGQVFGSFGFTGNFEAGNKVINNIVVLGGPGLLGIGATLKDTNLPFGTTLTAVSNGFGVNGFLANGFPIVNNAPSGVGQITSGIEITSPGNLPAGTTIVSQVPAFTFSGTATANGNTITGVPDTTTGLAPGVLLIGVAGIPADGYITSVVPGAGNTVDVTFNGTSTIAAGPVNPSATSYFVVSQVVTGPSQVANSSVSPYAIASNPASGTATASPVTQSAFAVMSNPAILSSPDQSLRQLTGSLSGNSNSITFMGNVGAANEDSTVEINAGGSIIQKSGVIAAHSVLLTSMNGNVGVLNRTFTNNIYTPTGTPLVLSLIPDAFSVPGNVSVISTNPFDNSSPGTVNLQIGGSNVNINLVQAGGDVLLTTTGLGSAGSLNVLQPMSSAYGAITILNSNKASDPSGTTGAINISSNINAAGGPLVIQNNNSGNAANSINLLSSAATPLTLSGVGWFLDGLAATNVINSASTKATTVSGNQAGVALVTGNKGAYPAPPLADAGNPGNITANIGTNNLVTFGSTGTLFSNTPDTVVNANGASVVFQGVAGTTDVITLGDSGTINATSSALVISSLDLKNATVVANLTALAAAPGSGVTGTVTTAKAGLVFDPTTATIPFSLANLATLNTVSGQSITFANFGTSNPVAVNVSSSFKNASVAGTISFLGSSAGTPNSFNSDGRIFLNSNVIGQVLTLAGTISSDNNLLVNAGGSVTISGALNGGTNGTLGLFTGAATAASTTISPSTLPAGLLTLTGGDLNAGSANNIGRILVNANSIKATSTASIVASDVRLDVGGTNFTAATLLIPFPIIIPLFSTPSSITGIPTITASSLSISAASGATINLTLTGTSNVANLALDLRNSPATFSQAPALSVSALPTTFVGSLVASSNVLSTNIADLVVGATIKSAGVAPGTTIQSLQESVPFNGDIGANSNVITNVPETTPLVVGAQIIGDAIPLGATITDISPPSGGFITVTFLPISTIPAPGVSVNFTQASYATMSNPASISTTRQNFQNYANPTTLDSLTLTSSGSTGSISTASNLSCGDCVFNAPSITNLNKVSSIDPLGIISLSGGKGGLTVVQTDGVTSGSFNSIAGLKISAALALSVTGGAFNTERSSMLITQTGTGDLNVTNALFSAGKFSGTPLGPMILPTDVSAAGAISIQETGKGNFKISDSGFNTVAGNISLSNIDGTLDVQGVFQADGGSVLLLNSGATTKITGTSIIANALGTSATNSSGGVVEISSGTNISQIAGLSQVPGTVPQFPLFNQPDGGPAQPLGGNVAIDNNAGGSSVYATGAIMQNITGTPVLNAGNSSTAQTSLNLFGGGIIFDAAGTSSLLMNDSIVTTNGFTPLAAKTGGNGDTLEIEMDDSDELDMRALAHVFTHGHKNSLMLSTHGFVDSIKNGNLLAAPRASEFTMKSGSMFLKPLSQTTIHSAFADIKAKKGALLAVSVEAAGLRVAACSGPGHVTVSVGDRSIDLSAGEELLISDHKLSSDELSKADGIGRRNFSSYKLASGLHANICEVSLFSLLSNWEHLASAKSSPSNASATESNTNEVAKSISDKLLKTAAALTMLTQSRGAYQAKAKERQSSGEPSFIPVNYASQSRTKLRASAE